jgi:hypothetical protein
MLWVVLLLILAVILYVYYLKNKKEKCCGYPRNYHKEMFTPGESNLPKSMDSSRYLPDINARYWPTYYYSFPYQYKYSGAFPDDMYTRLRYWSPGFYTGSGWRHELRPGMGFKYWPRDRWVRSTKVGGNNSYYYISQRGDYTHDPKFLLKYKA